MSVRDTAEPWSLSVGSVPSAFMESSGYYFRREFHRHTQLTSVFLINVKPVKGWLMWQPDESVAATKGMRPQKQYLKSKGPFMR